MSSARLLRYASMLALVLCAFSANTAHAQTSGCRSDVDGDGIVSTPDLVLLLAFWGPCPDPPVECLGDINGDGNVDVSDLRAILADWGKICEGACCLDGGTCIVTTNPVCADAGGVYQGNDTDCTNDPCAPTTGACCLGDGSCVVRALDECEELNGAYQGDGSNCDNVECPDPKAACCFEDGECAVITQVKCLAQGGSYQGDGTDCVDTFCPQPRAACCFDDGDCAVITQEDCIAQGGNYQGDGTNCVDTHCPQPPGACCFGDGECAVLTPEDCVAQFGDYQGMGTNCDDAECPQPPGACCFGDGECAVLTPADCLAQFGDYQGDGSTCASANCPQPPGACCFPDGSCGVFTEADCVHADGLPQGDFTTCANTHCPQPPGACCLKNGVCAIIPEAECLNVGGAPQGDFTTCEDVECVDPPAACCFDDGGCIELQVELCILLEGTPQGAGSSCAGVSCPQPPGACCLMDGTCVEVTAAGCADMQGDFFGEFSLCVDTECPQPPGACCLVDGECVEVTQEECTDLMGDFIGDFTLCADVDCPILCEGVIGDFIWRDDNGDGCQDPGEPGIPDVRVTLFEDCDQPNFLHETFTDMNGKYIFMGLCEGEYLVVIDDSTVPDGFMETAPDNCNDDTVDSDCVNGEICVVLPDDFTEDTTNDCGFVPPFGACCLELQGTCIETSEADCLAQGGTYQGDFTTCADADCPVFGQDCCENGKPVTLTMVYTADDCSATSHSQNPDKVDCEDFGPLPDTVRILSTDKANPDDGGAKVWFDGTVSFGEAYIISAVSAGETKLANETYIHIFDLNGNLLQSVEFHTSCSQPLETGNQFGASLLVDCTGEDEPIEGDCCANGKPAVLTMEYTGEDCSATDESQDAGKVDCDDFGPLPMTVRILSTNKDDPDASDAKVWFDGTVSIGDTFDISAFNAGVNRLENETFIYIFDLGGDLLQASEFHTSCSQPLFVGNQFGASLLVACLGEDELFSCDGKVQELSMIWDGMFPVRIRAYKGDVGAELLADIDFIAVGDEVTVGGYAGAPNDVIWEVFVAGTDMKIGESKFHLSCSDNEMNGPEDCGNRQGNGKGNDSGFINDWLLSGLVDDNNVLDCSALPF